MTETSANVLWMPAKRPTSGAVAAFLRHLVKQELKAGASTRALGKRLGTSHVTVQAIASGDNRLTDMVMVERIAHAFHLEMPGLYEKAAEFVAEHPEELGQPSEPRVELPVRYDNCALAAEVARRSGVPEEAIRVVESRHLKSSSDQTPEEWFEDMKAEARRLRREAQQGPTAGERLSDSELAELNEQTRPKLPRTPEDVAELKARAREQEESKKKRR